MGELAALRECDLDFESKIINVTRTIVYQKLDGDTKKEFHIGPPKTKTSIRKVPMNNISEQALRKQLLQKKVVEMKKPKSKVDANKYIKRSIVSKKATIEELEFQNNEFADLLFTTQYNTPLNAQNFSDAIKRIVNEINLMRDSLEEMEYFSSHTFRHTFATRAFESGVEPKTVQQWLGHATLQMTMDLYTHVLGEHSTNEMDKLNNTFDSTFGTDDQDGTLLVH